MKITFLNKDYFAYEHTDVEYCFGKMQPNLIGCHNIDSFVSENSCLCFSVRYSSFDEACYFHARIFNRDCFEFFLYKKDYSSSQNHSLQDIINGEEIAVLEKISYLLNNTDENAPEKKIAKDEFDKWMILL